MNSNILSVIFFISLSSYFRDIKYHFNNKKIDNEINIVIAINTNVRIKNVEYQLNVITLLLKYPIILDKKAETPANNVIAKVISLKSREFCTFDLSIRRSINCNLFFPISLAKLNFLL